MDNSLMKSAKINFLFVSLFVLISAQAFAVPPTLIKGPDVVSPGSTQGYYFNAIAILSSPSWVITGGTVSYTDVDGGTQYSVTIHWGSAGTGTVELKDGTATLDTKNVTISTIASTYLSGGGDYCAGQSANITLFSTVSGQSYQLYRNDSTVLTAQPGTGGTVTWSVNSGGTYTCTATPGGAVSGSAFVVMDLGPTAYYLIGNPGCSGSTVTLSDSDAPSVGTAYFLRRDGTIVGTGSVGGTGHAISWTGLTVQGTYTVTAQGGDGCPSTMSGSIPINPIPSAPPSIATVERCGPGSVALTGIAGANGYTLKWYSASTGGTSLGTGLSYSPSSVSTTTYYASSYSTAGCESVTRTPAIASIKPVPNIVTTRQRNLCSGESTDITITDSNSVPGTTFAWTYGGANIAGGSSGSGSTINQTLTRTGTASLASATYTVTATGGNGCAATPLTKSFTVTTSQISCVEKSYVVSHTILTGNITNQGDVEFLPLTSVNQTISYVDGVGRPIQTVTKHGSPSNKDLVQPISYDVYGREQHKYLPFAQGVTGRYNSTFNAKEGANYSTTANTQFEFYQGTTGIPTDTVPYSTVVFEPSPLNRPVAEFGPGQKWAEDNKKIAYSYPANIHGASTSGSQEKIIAWTVDASLSLTRDTNLADGYYPSASLSIKGTKDEQGHEVREYTNKEGQMILKKVYVTGSAIDFNTLGNWAETYYVYDSLGNLAFVLPPEAVRRILQNN
jgi:hypothetical protein